MSGPKDCRSDERLGTLDCQSGKAHHKRNIKDPHYTTLPARISPAWSNFRRETNWEVPYSSCSEFIIIKTKTIEFYAIVTNYRM